MCTDYGLVPENRRVEEKTIHLRCAHGNVVTHSLADLELEVGRVTMKVRATVADKLTVSIQMCPTQVHKRTGTAFLPCIIKCPHAACDR